MKRSVCLKVGMVLVSLAAIEGSALATCRITNRTGVSFKVESGNTSGQSVDGHSVTSIASGRIVGKSNDGKTISGHCSDRDELVIEEKDGVPIMEPKK